MTKPENDEEKRSRDLRELEGKNIAYYSIILQTVIESELEAIKQIMALSSVGIGLQFAMDRHPSGTGAWMNVTFSIGSVLSFAGAIICGIVFLLRASTKYEQELRGTDSLAVYASLLNARKSFTRWKRASLVTFVAGVLFLGANVVADGIEALRGQSKAAAQVMPIQMPTSHPIAPNTTSTQATPIEGACS